MTGRATPVVFKVVTGILDAAPSEASVERLFSMLKFSFDPWRNRASTGLVNAALGVAAAYRFFKPTDGELRAEAAAAAPTPSPSPLRPSRRHMSEDASGAATQSEPHVHHVDDEAEAEEPTEELFSIGNEVQYAFDTIIEKYVAKVRPAATVRPRRAGPATRSATDKCDCGKLCANHTRFAGYMECMNCKQRRSCEHNGKYHKDMYIEHKLRPQIRWTCKACI